MSGTTTPKKTPKKPDLLKAFANVSGVLASSTPPVVNVVKPKPRMTASLKIATAGS